MVLKIHNHLKSRFIDPKCQKVWIDEAEGIATFPLTNLSGQLVGYQQYRPAAGKEKKNHPKEGRYFTYTKKECFGVWGLESWNFSNTLYITEGIFDAARIIDLGYSAIATLSNDPRHLSEWLMVVRQMRPIVAICDGDSAGMKLAKYGHAYHMMPEGTDLGDASTEYVLEILNK